MDFHAIPHQVQNGVHTGLGGLGGVDSRMYDQTAGMASGFGTEGEYNTYCGWTAQSLIYRPTRRETEYDAEERTTKWWTLSLPSFNQTKVLLTQKRVWMYTPDHERRRSSLKRDET
jgi:hypothetical protein